MTLEAIWTCPNCTQVLALSSDESAWCCPAGHSFDKAREGYVNLLPANRKRSRSPGDNADMIGARRRVHEAQIYQGLARALQDLVLELGPVGSVLDLGCGEGYYTAALLAVAPKARIQAVDISRPAVRLGAKRYPEAHFAVASAAQLPLPDTSTELVSSIFAPVNETELLRVLAPAGYYLKVTPGPKHMWALREALYPQPRAHVASDESIPGLELRQSRALDYDVQLNATQLADVIAMTPFAYRGDNKRREELLRGTGMRMGLSFNLALYQRSAAD